MNFYWRPAVRLIFLAYFLICVLPKPLLGIDIDVHWLIIDFWSFPRPVVANFEAQKTHKIAPRWIMCLFQLLEVQKYHQSTQTHINTQFWHPTWPCLVVNNTPISFSWIYLLPIFLTTQLNLKCSKIAKISKLKLQLLQKNNSKTSESF